MKRGGGSAQTETAVDRALQWLAYHQEADGHWDVSKHGGINGGWHSPEVGCTGLALLAFLGRGNTEKVGEYKDNVQRAVKWLIQQQAQDGSFGTSNYGHGICTMALSEAAGMSRIPETRVAAQKAVNFISQAQIRTDADGYDREGWDYAAYGKPLGKVTDTSVSSWMTLALKSAKVAGLQVDHQCFEGVLHYLDAVQGDDEYKVGITYRTTIAEQKARVGDPPLYGNNFLGPHALLAASGVMRMFTGCDPASPRITNIGEYLMKELPKWDPRPSAVTTRSGIKNDQGGSVCFYHIYYGTLCTFQIGGECWKKWNLALKETLLPNQATKGDDAGSWDPKIDWSGELGGRVYTTAMGALSLEVYYRYLKLGGH